MMKMYDVFFISVDVIDSLMSDLGNGRAQCLQCGVESRKQDLRRHVEAKHLDTSSYGYSCHLCHALLKNKIALKNHLARSHKSC